MAKREITPNDITLQGNPDGNLKTVIVSNHWANDLVMAYAKVAGDVFCRQEIAIDIVDNCPAALGVIDSIARTISSLDFNIVPGDSSDYLIAASKRAKNELLMALGRIDGYDGLVSAFVYDLLTKPTGFFGQYATDGNGRPVGISTINCRTPRPYYDSETESYNSLSPSMSGRMRIVEDSRGVMNTAGIWWVDGDRTYALPKSNYKQSVDGARGHGAFLVGRSIVEKNRLRLWLSATLEEYIQRVTSGTDESGLLIMNNLAWRALLKQIETRKKTRKQDVRNTEDQGGFLYAANVGKEVGDAKWVSFRQFPEGIDFLDFWGMANEMVASAFGVKAWRINSGDSANNSGKFGNAKRAVQMDAQEPTVQWVMSRFQSFINNIYFFNLPLQFMWVGGSSAADSIKIDNQARIAQTVTQATYMGPDEQRRLAIMLGAPREAFNDGGQISSSTEGIVKKTLGDVDALKADLALSCASIMQSADRYGVDPERIDDVVDAFSVSVNGGIESVLRRTLAEARFTPKGRQHAAAVRAYAGEMAGDLKTRLLRLADEPLYVNPQSSLDRLSVEFYGGVSKLYDDLMRGVGR